MCQPELSSTALSFQEKLSDYWWKGVLTLLAGKVNQQQGWTKGKVVEVLVATGVKRAENMVLRTIIFAKRLEN